MALQLAWRLRRPVPAIRAPRLNVEIILMRPNWFSSLFTLRFKDDGKQLVDDVQRLIERMTMRRCCRFPIAGFVLGLGGKGAKLGKGV